MLINLRDIPAEGKEFICNEKTGDLNEALRDLIGSAGHEARFFIYPIPNGTFQLKGTIKTTLPEDCSRCGIDFQLKLSEKFEELLMPTLETPRGSKYARVNHLSDAPESGPSVAEYQGHHFNMGEYLHEFIAISEPLIPAPEEDQEGNCSLCKKKVRGVVFSYEDQGFETPTNPFEALKKLKQ
ncbi:MAG: DUF177 domain-containing protein [Proteobacteria bacterium]|jgi:uncharacterized protein|nr:DUF177 domain-containing protein [Pseudomonadota bacterium]